MSGLSKVADQLLGASPGFSKGRSVGWDTSSCSTDRFAERT